METNAILAPAAVLILWSMLVLLYLVKTRFPAFESAGLKIDEAEPGARYADVEAVMPAKANWVSHNYSHLMEQPTLFYGVIAVLALADGASLLTVILAWAYVLLRIVHSLWQIRVNRVKERVIIFATSSTCLLALALCAVWITLLG